MNTRRGFFRRVAAVVAAVAIAPEIAFRTRLELPEVEKLNLEDLFNEVYALRQHRASYCYDEKYLEWMRKRAAGGCSISQHFFELPPELQEWPHA